MGEALTTGEEVVIAKDDALEALRSGDRSVLDAWYAQELPARNTTVEGLIGLDAQKAEILAEAGDYRGAIEVLDNAVGLMRPAGISNPQLEMMLQRRIDDFRKEEERQRIAQARNQNIK